MAKAVLHRRLKIGVMVDPVYSHGRGISRGIINYGVPLSWQFQRYAGDFFGTYSESALGLDGMIVSVIDAKMSALANSVTVPVVNVSTLGNYAGRPSAVCDNRAVGRLAATHFVERGLKNLAFVGRKGLNWSTEREAAYVEMCEELGIECAMYPSELEIGAITQEGRVTMMSEWLMTLPPRTGIFAANDWIAEAVLSAGARTGRAVPDDLAVLGADNDEIYGMICTPPLSSIDINSMRIGYEAARMLDGMMRGEPPPADPVRVPPTGVVTRTSSDILALSDPDVLAAVRFIRDRAALAIGVEDVVNSVPLARRTLEARFKAERGWTILEEIHRAHVERATQLLVETDLPMTNIARSSGFANYTRMGIVFRKVQGMSPRQYRKKFKTAK